MDKRTILAFVLCGLTVVLFQLFYIGPLQKRRREWFEQKKRAEEEKLRKQEAKEEDGDDDGGDEGRPASAPATRPLASKPAEPEPVEGPPEPALTAEEPEERVLDLAGRGYHARLSNLGASLLSLTFEDIHADGEALCLLRTVDENVRPFSLKLESGEPLHRAAWEVAAAQEGRVLFRTEAGGLRLEKEFVAPAEGMHFFLTVRLENAGAEAREAGYVLNGPAGFTAPQEPRDPGPQIVFGIRDPRGGIDIQLKPASDITSDEGRVEVQQWDRGRIAFVGVEAKYFAAVVAPLVGDGLPEWNQYYVDAARGVSLDSLVEVDGRVLEELGTAEDPALYKDQVVPRLLVPASKVRLAPGASIEHRYLVYVGPKWRKTFAASPLYERIGFTKLPEEDYGWFSSLSTLFLYILFALHGICGNYGFAIIILTLLVRAAMHPLSVRQQRTMLRMQKLQPEMKKIQEKYGNKSTPEARQKMSGEVMELYRKHGVSPIGCVGPLLLQMPIFIALYYALNYAYDLRQQPFVLWIDDLSRADRLLTLPFKMPLHDTDALSVLPILMILTYLLQQRLSPKPVDPQQAQQQKMMSFIFPVIGYMFYSLPSGLLLYFVTSSLVGILEQKWIRMRLEKEKTAPPPKKK